MLGYHSLLGSHDCDRYDITYYNFAPNGTTYDDFAFDVQCGSRPGPDDTTTGSERSVHMIVQNPITTYKYVVQLDRYDHIDYSFEEFANMHGQSYDGLKHKSKSWFNFLDDFRFINGKNQTTSWR